jgi:predicted ABC-type transport system involved in lysophospholipase L1 biosynthesis ATPase subunit
MIWRYPGLLILVPPNVPAESHAERVAVRHPLRATPIGGVQRRAGVDAKAAGLALARAGISVDMMRRPAFACSREVRRRIDLAVALARGATVLIVDDWLHGLEERTTRKLADTLHQLASIDTAVYIVGVGLERFFPRTPAGLSQRVARSLLGAATTNSAILVW